MAEATTQSGGRANIATGTFTGAGAAVDVELGFTPRYIELINVTDAIIQKHIEGMPSGSVLNTTAAGANSIDTGSLLLIDTNGFTVGAGAAISAKEYVWMASA